MTSPAPSSRAQAQRPGQNVSPKPGAGGSPLRFLFSLIARLRQVEGPSLATDLAQEAIEEEQQGLARCAKASDKVETALERYTRRLKEAVADGVLTAEEQASLNRLLGQAKRQAHATTESIAALQ